MKQVRLNEVVDREVCENAILGSGKVPKVWQLHESWICGQASQEESPDNILCKGDGGGPLVCQEQGSEQHVLNGIIAFGNLMIVGFVLKHLKRRVQIIYYAKEMEVDHW